MPADRLDAIVLGADIEGLFAAVSLASAGKYVAVFETNSTDADDSAGQDSFASLAAVEELDLISHGVRLGAPPAIVGIAQDQSLVLWPAQDAAQASIALVSQRDADAYEGFCARIMRGATFNGLNADNALSNWHLAANANGDPASENSFLRATSVARLLDEEFSSSLLKGMLAQGAALGTGVSLRAPGSASLLMRQSLISLFGDEHSVRYVAGGAASLRQALLTSLKYFNNADFHTEQEIKSLLFDKSGVQGVVLRDGTSVRAPTVISTVGLERTLELSRGSILLAEDKATYARPGQVHFRTRSVPVFRGIGAGTAMSGAIVRLNPTLERLSRGYGAYRARHLIQDYCLDIRVIPCREPLNPARWDVFATVLYVPSVTDEGPWSGNRRDRFVTAVAKAIDVWCPGFEASIESSALVSPSESQTFIDSDVPVPLERQAKRDPVSAPDVRFSGVEKLFNGLWLVDPSLTVGAGLAGLKVAKLIGSTGRAKASSDA
ncbi:MAG: hypothetical protein ABL973_06490 [Micropepsaceae bacterium]